MSRAEKQREYARNWKLRNPEKVRAQRKAARASDPAKHRERSRAWRDANPEAVRAHSANYRARKGGHSDFTASDVRWLIAAQKGKCAICFKKLAGPYHVDHREPLSAGGSNERLNLQVVHPVCNLRKGAKRPHIFASQQGFLL